MSQKTQKHLDGLDTLRGFAALTVFVNHAILFSPKFWQITWKSTNEPWVNWIAYSPLHFFWNGYEAVLLFFVLSGFVLYFSYGSAREDGYPSFAVKRFLRIYPAFAFAMLLTGILMISAPRETDAGLSDWFNLIVWRTAFDWNSYLRNLALIDSYDPNQYDPVIWTLRVEALASFLFPIVFWMSNRRRWPAYLLLLVFLTWIAYRFWFDGVVLFLPMFLAGALAARFKKPLVDFFRSRNAFTFAAILALGALCSLSRIQGNVPGMRPVMKVLFDELIAFSALIFVLAVASGRLDRLFLWRPAVAFGKRSYSFYLLHLPILFSLMRVLHGHWNKPSIVALAFVVSVLLSMASYEWIEKPGIRAGHACARRLSRRGPTPVSG